MRGEEVVHGGQWVVGLPIRLAARHVREITHDTVRDDQIRTGRHQRCVGFQLTPNVIPAVVGVKQYERRVSGVLQAPHLVDHGGVGRIALDQRDSRSQPMACERLSHAGPDVDINAHDPSLTQRLAQRRVVKQRTAFEDPGLDH